MGQLLQTKLKELTDAEEHKGQRKMICLTHGRAGLLTGVEQPPKAAACEKCTKTY